MKQYILFLYDRDGQAGAEYAEYGRFAELDELHKAADVAVGDSLSLCVDILDLLTGEWLQGMQDGKWVNNSL